MTPNLLPCPFCGSADVEIQGKPAILDALDSVCCNECTADAPYPVWNTRAKSAPPSPDAELVACLKFARTTMAVVADNANLRGVEYRSLIAEIKRIDAKLAGLKP